MTVSRTHESVEMEEVQSKKGWWRPTWVGAVQGCVWLYVLMVLAVWFLIRFGGDRWWLATVMLFGPRWVYGLPLLLLVPAAALRRRRLLLPLAASAIVLVGPIAGLCLPLGQLLAAGRAGHPRAHLQRERKMCQQ